MRITRRDPSHDRSRQLVDDIAEAVLAEGVEGRVCAESCTVTCPDCGSTGCQCMCSVHCPEAPGLLSSDPEKYPVEPGVMPLVFEMKRLGIFRPCWSCEGHLGPDGSLWKVPRVWFYCESMVHIRLLTDGLKDMEKAGKIRAPWQVVVTFSDADNPETTFSLEPAQFPGNELRLPMLQKDVMVIAESLRDLMSSLGRKLQHDARKALAGTG